MKQRKRLIVRNVISHCYQRTAGGVVIFYNISDYLVLFTIFCTTARKYKVKILSLCLMADHIHICISEERKGELSAFVREYSKLFSRVHNRTCHTQGNLFESPFGSAPEFGDKKARANLIYIGNNAPERRLHSSFLQIFLRQGLVPDIPQYPQSRYNFFPKRKILDIRATSVLVQKVEQGSKYVHDVLGLPIAEKFQVFLQLNKYTDAFPEQIAAFLRMPLSRAEK